MHAGNEVVKHRCVAACHKVHRCPGSLGVDKATVRRYGFSGDLK
jgi:hypothetical protein